jgi:hypothetical protein
MADEEKPEQAPEEYVFEQEPEERGPRDIFEALNAPKREPVCIGESLGNWRR